MNVLLDLLQSGLKVLLISNLLLLTCCVSRLSRPMITGVIVDENARPIDSCRVGEVLTNHEGIFLLPETRYYQFLLMEIFHTEAPPLVISETVHKHGYHHEQISYFVPYGGSASKGSVWNLDTISLNKN